MFGTHLAQSTLEVRAGEIGEVMWPLHHGGLPRKVEVLTQHAQQGRSRCDDDLGTDLPGTYVFEHGRHPVDIGACFMLPAGLMVLERMQPASRE